MQFYCSALLNLNDEKYHSSQVQIQNGHQVNIKERTKGCGGRSLSRQFCELTISNAAVFVSFAKVRHCMWAMLHCNEWLRSGHASAPAIMLDLPQSLLTWTCCIFEHALYSEHVGACERFNKKTVGHACFGAQTFTFCACAAQPLQYCSCYASHLAALKLVLLQRTKW